VARLVFCYYAEVVRSVLRFTLSLVTAIVSGLGVFVAVVQFSARRLESACGPNVFVEEAGASISILFDAVLFGIPLALVACLAAFWATMMLPHPKPASRAGGAANT